MCVLGSLRVRVGFIRVYIRVSMSVRYLFEYIWFSVRCALDSVRVRVGLLRVYIRVSMCVRDHFEYM